MPEILARVHFRKHFRALHDRLAVLKGLNEKIIRARFIEKCDLLHTAEVAEKKLARAHF